MVEGRLNSDDDLVKTACLPVFQPKLVVSSSLPMGQCHLVIDTAILGRSWGGFRIAEGLSLGEVKVLARTMTIKTALAGIPIGGAKAGASVSAMPYDRTELLREVCKTVGPYIKHRRYFLGTDLGFTESDANFLYECAGSDRRIRSGAMSVGEACAEGVSASLGYVERNGICQLDRRTVALEGFGRIGSPTARLLASQGFRIVAISNLAGTLYDPRGLDVNELSSVKERSPQAMLSTYRTTHEGAELLPRERLLHLDSEVLIPGARALTIDQEVAAGIKAKAVCPISNAPVTLTGEETLIKRGIVSVPDIISNTGGLIAGFAQHLGADTSQTTILISEVITHNLQSVFANLPSNEIPKKIAARLGFQRLEKIQKSEKIGALRCLSPWLRTLGLRAIVDGFKEYLALKIGG